MMYLAASKSLDDSDENEETKEGGDGGASADGLISPGLVQFSGHIFDLAYRVRDMLNDNDQVIKKRLEDPSTNSPPTNLIPLRTRQTMETPSKNLRPEKNKHQNAETCWQPGDPDYACGPRIRGIVRLSPSPA